MADENTVSNGIDTSKVKRFVTSLLPDKRTRTIYLSMFLESLKQANSYGSNKWSVYYENNHIRLVVGGHIVFTIQRDFVSKIWLALDRNLLDELKAEQHKISDSENWQWDNGKWSSYKRISSRNGFYIPSKDHSYIWPVIRRFHFASIHEAARFVLRRDSQSKCSYDLLTYLRIELGEDVPNPDYWDLHGANPIQDLDEFKATYDKEPETEREAIVQSRVGQGEFRNKLIRYWKGCAVTGCDHLGLLRASHIKPWRSSDNIERLDVFNGLLLIPNLDSAFDNGLVSFDNEGKLIISDLLTGKDRDKLGIHPEMCVRKLDARHVKYLEYHRKNVFRKN